MKTEELLDAFHEITKVSKLGDPAFAIACRVLAEYDVDQEKVKRVNQIVDVIKGSDDDEDCARKLVEAGYFCQKDISRTLEYQILESKFKSSESNLAALSEILKEATFTIRQAYTDEGDWWNKAESFLNLYDWEDKE